MDMAFRGANGVYVHQVHANWCPSFLATPVRSGERVVVPSEIRETADVVSIRDSRQCAERSGASHIVIDRAGRVKTCAQRKEKYQMPQRNST